MTIIIIANKKNNTLQFVIAVPCGVAGLRCVVVGFVRTTGGSVHLMPLTPPTL